MAIGIFLLLLVFGASADEESSSWTQEQIDQLPHWGTFVASTDSAPDELTFAIGEHFQNADLRGRVTLRNSTSSEIVVGTIDTDCNCTAAFVKERTIPSGETRSVLIRVDSTEVGERNVKLAVQMNGQVHIGFINVRIRPTFAVTCHAEFIEGKPAEVCVDVKDPKIAPSDVQFQSTRSDIKVLKTTIEERQLVILTFLNPFQSFASGTYSVKGRMEDAEFQFNVAISGSNGG